MTAIECKEKFCYNIICKKNKTGYCRTHYLNYYDLGINRRGKCGDIRKLKTKEQIIIFLMATNHLTRKEAENVWNFKREQ